MIYVISKATFGSYNVRDIQCNANWDCCPYSDYALIPDNLVEGVLATQGYCDITLNADGTEVTGFTARSIPPVPEECCGTNTVLSVNGVKADTNGAVSLTPDNVGAAPAGYGLGEDGCFIYDMNAINFNGFFICQGNVANAPSYNNGSGTYDYGWGYSVSRWGTYVEVNYFPCLSDRLHLVRNKIDGVWGEWEYVNPPMFEGAEYRTTERHHGKPVYAKVVSYYIDGSGAGSVSGVTDLTIPHDISNFGALVRCAATCSIFPLPIRDGENRCVTVYSVDSNNITLRFINDAWSSAPFKFTLYYTKA